MENNQSYKIYQISNCLLSNYDYKPIVIKQYQSLMKMEAWLVNYNNPNYQVIRISFFACPLSNEENERVNNYLTFFKNDSKKEDDLKFLDIHICKDEYNKDLEIYDYINFEENYSSGIDLSKIYPEIYNCVHNVTNVSKEITRLDKLLRKNREKRLSKLPFFQRYPALFTYIIIGICCGVFFVSSYLGAFYDQASALLLCGADYKMLTLGCKEYYRLITYAFVHSDLVHIFCNMVSLFSLGRYIEIKHGHVKFLVIIFVSILCGSLTQGILSDNELCVGMSGGIYGLFIAFIIDTVECRIIDLRRLIPTILLNVMLNFLTTTAWMAHLGGAIAGLACYYALTRKNNYGGIGLVVVLILCLLFKYVTISSINTFYGGTDTNYLELLRSLGFDTSKLLIKFIDAYQKFGG